MDKPILQHDLLLSYYGDDFTGSADVMESLALNGIPTALFLDPPAPLELAQFQLKIGLGGRPGTGGLKAFGVAGIARSLSPQQMDEQLPDIFSRISKIPSDFFQIKVCSTFDSSPEIGNIGHATELALQYFPSDYIPLLIGAPFLNRFVVFGNLFARVGETTFRLDRHPTMSRHPVTPMHESDLREHLGRQTNRKVALIDVFGLEGDYGPVAAYFQRLTEEKGNFLLFDTLHAGHLATIGKLLIENKSKKPQLIVGASGANYALSFYLQEQGKIEKPRAIPHPGKAEKMIVVAGSCSYATAGQIEHMASLGHAAIRLDTLKLIDPLHRTEEITGAVAHAIQTFQNGRVPMFYTAQGPDDPIIRQTKLQLSRVGDVHTNTSEILAGAQGAIVKDLIARMGKMRVAIAGGDTSGYVSRALGIYALETLCPIAPGSPLCLAHSRDERFDGLEIALKGGQNGNERYFESILAGEPLG